MVIKRLISAYFLLSGLMYLLPAMAADAAGKIDPSIHLRGVVLPGEQVKIAFSQGGLLLEMLGNGKSAAKGEILARIDDNKARADMHKNQALMQSASSALKAAEHKRSKTARLVKENILSDIALVEADFEIEMAKSKEQAARAQLALSKIALANCVIYAPFDGTIVTQDASINEWVKSGTPIMEYATLNQLVLSIDVPPDFIQYLNPGQETAITINQQVVGKVQLKQIFPHIDPASGLRRIIWSVQADNNQILSGRYVELENWLPQQ
ncbi:efflux RND transporter periplasmic adaptor subunit [Thalassomonas actiniarum]|uniref:Efflux RND transporter periplasmic adaptor subunit n=1 Tax=Thalassomonas actiniarum TaxID=485447 RepID=A0AAE9YSR7_9GAMM|nr:efflux RND transporter periplasmic adaptor subunit [Thalassomonas actiniarum]WDE00411.1 efflux RND transporter periplasmic adaptor subunit [Thalassomonas actiniarum]